MVHHYTLKSKGGEIFLAGEIGKRMPLGADKEMMVNYRDSRAEKRKECRRKEMINTMCSSKMHIALLLLTLLLMPLTLHAKAPEFYTLQAGSFPKDTRALQQFDELSRGLRGKELESLRIEKVGKFFTVRVGKFMNRSAAKEYLEASASELAGAVILKAYVKDERIVKSYKSESEEREFKSAEPAILPEKTAEEKAMELIQQIVSEHQPAVPVTGTDGTEDKRDETPDGAVSEISATVNTGYMGVKTENPSDAEGNNHGTPEGAITEKPKTFSTGYLVVKRKRTDEIEDQSFKVPEGAPAVSPGPSSTGYLIVTGKRPAETVDHIKESPYGMLSQTSEAADNRDVAAETEIAAEPLDYKENAAVEPLGRKEEISDESAAFAKPAGSSSYTIQTGSFTKLPDATKQFNAVLNELKDMSPEHLRIEKIGKFYTVRVGQFADRIGAYEYVQAGSPSLANASVLKAYIKEERIIERYSRGHSVPDVVISEDYQPPADTKDEIESLLLALQEPEEEPEPASQGEAPVMAGDRKNAAAEVQVKKKPERPDKGGVFSEIKGKFYVSDYYSSDSGSYDYHVLTSRLNLYNQEPDKSGAYFKFDGRVRGKISDGDVHDKIPDYDVNEFWFAYKFPGEQINVSVGRQNIYELYNTAVDGVDITYFLNEKYGVGFFGGLAPDKYDYSFNNDFLSLGGYGFYESDKYQWQLGYENLSYKGATDREYFSFKLFSHPMEKVRFNVISSASINQITNEFDIENVNTNLLYAYSKDLRFNLYFNYYKAMKFYESSKNFFDQIDLRDSYFLDTNSQTRVGARADYKIAKNLRVYGSVVHQKRKIDDKDAMRYTGGIRKNDLFGFDVSARYRYIDNYTSRSDEFNVQLSRRFFNKLDVSVYASHEEEELDIENGFTTGLLTYGSSLYWDISRHFYLSLFAERYDEDDYYNTSLFTQVGYRLR